MNFNKQNSRSFLEVLSDQQFAEILKNIESTQNSASNNGFSKEHQI